MIHKLNPSRKGDYHLLIGPYDQDLYDWLKANVPASHREWAGVAKAWRIRPEYVAEVQAYLDGRSTP